MAGLQRGVRVGCVLEAGTSTLLVGVSAVVNGRTSVRFRPGCELCELCELFVSVCRCVFFKSLYMNSGYVSERPVQPNCLVWTGTCTTEVLAHHWHTHDHNEPNTDAVDGLLSTNFTNSTSVQKPPATITDAASDPGPVFTSRNPRKSVGMAPCPDPLGFGGASTSASVGGTSPSSEDTRTAAL